MLTYYAWVASVEGPFAAKWPSLVRAGSAAINGLAGEWTCEIGPDPLARATRFMCPDPSSAFRVRLDMWRFAKGAADPPDRPQDRPGRPPLTPCTRPPSARTLLVKGGVRIRTHTV